MKTPVIFIIILSAFMSAAGRDFTYHEKLVHMRDSVKEHYNAELFDYPKISYSYWSDELVTAWGKDSAFYLAEFYYNYCLGMGPECTDRQIAPSEKISFPADWNIPVYAETQLLHFIPSSSYGRHRYHFRLMSLLQDNVVLVYDYFPEKDSLVKVKTVRLISSGENDGKWVKRILRDGSDDGDIHLHLLGTNGLNRRLLLTDSLSFETVLNNDLDISETVTAIHNSLAGTADGSIYSVINGITNLEFEGPGGAVNYINGHGASCDSGIFLDWNNGTWKAFEHQNLDYIFHTPKTTDSGRGITLVSSEYSSTFLLLEDTPSRISQTWPEELHSLINGEPFRYEDNSPMPVRVSIADNEGNIDGVNLSLLSRDGTLDSLGTVSHPSAWQMGSCGRRGLNNHQDPPFPEPESENFNWTDGFSPRVIVTRDSITFRIDKDVCSFHMIDGMDSYHWLYYGTVISHGWSGGDILIIALDNDSLKIENGVEMSIANSSTAANLSKPLYLNGRILLPDRVQRAQLYDIHGRVMGTRNGRLITITHPDPGIAILHMDGKTFKYILK